MKRGDNGCKKMGGHVIAFCQGGGWVEAQIRSSGTLTEGVPPVLGIWGSGMLGRCKRISSILQLLYPYPVRYLGAREETMVRLQEPMT